MRNLKKKVVVFATAASLAVVSMTGCASFENADTVATVGGDKIPAGVANFYARYQQGMIETNLGSMLGDNMWTQEVSEGKTYEDNVKDSVMDALQQMYILEDHMAEYEVVLTDEEKSAIQEEAKKFDEGNELEAKELVSGETEYVERVLTLLTIQKKMTDAVTKDVSTEVSDEEAAQKTRQAGGWASPAGHGGQSLSRHPCNHRRSAVESFRLRCQQTAVRICRIDHHQLYHHGTYRSFRPRQ